MSWKITKEMTKAEVIGEITKRVFQMSDEQLEQTLEAMSEVRDDDLRFYNFKIVG